MYLRYTDEKVKIWMNNTDSSCYRTIASIAIFACDFFSRGRKVKSQLQNMEITLYEQ